MAARKVRIIYFLEDAAHNQFVPPLVERIARELGISVGRVEIEPSYYRGSQVIRAFRQFLRDAQQSLRADLVVLCVDGNCKGPEEKRREFEREVQRHRISVPVIYAIPNPHIERWYLADPTAIRTVISSSLISFHVPPYKCERDFYKRILEIEVFEKVEIDVYQGGTEYGPDIANEIDFVRIMTITPCLNKFIDDIRQALKTAWQQIS